MIKEAKLLRRVSSLASYCGYCVLGTLTWPGKCTLPRHKLTALTTTSTRKNGSRIPHHLHRRDTMFLVAARRRKFTSRIHLSVSHFCSFSLLLLLAQKRHLDDSNVLSKKWLIQPCCCLIIRTRLVSVLEPPSISAVGLVYSSRAAVLRYTTPTKTVKRNCSATMVKKVISQASQPIH